MVDVTRRHEPAPERKSDAADDVGMLGTVAAHGPSRSVGGKSGPSVVVQDDKPKGDDLAPGTAVGEYTIGRKLGEGGMGTVYAGEQPTIGKRVAVKVLASHCATNVELVRRFLDEARAVNLIHHPNIIDIFSFGELPGPRQYFVMEYLDGESLADAIEHDHLRPDEIRRLLRQMCGALEATHKVGIVHRDLKPENIWIARPTHGESYVKLLDFGIAKLADPARTNVTQTGVMMGTPMCMSPEQCMGHHVDARADIYSMGVLLYRIFAGRYPFTGATTTELVLQHVTEPPPPPSTFRPISPDLQRLILDCLAKEPKDRPASAEILGARLEGAFAVWPQHRMAATLAQKTSESSMPEVRPWSLREERTQPARPARDRAKPWLWIAFGTIAVGAMAAWLALRPPKSSSVAPLAGLKPPPTESKPRPDPAVAPAVVDEQLHLPKPPPPTMAGPATRPRTPKPVASLDTKSPPPATPMHPLPAANTAENAAPSPVNQTQSTASPPRRPTRAQEHGLLDENPLRR